MSLNEYYEQTVISLTLEEATALSLGFSDETKEAYLTLIERVISCIDLSACAKVGFEPKEMSLGFFFDRSKPYFKIMGKMHQNFSYEKNFM